MIEGIPFTKVHGCGNDFVLIERPRLSAQYHAMFEARLGLTHDAGFVRAICDRRTGIGAAGVLLLDRDDDQWAARIINADGTDGGMCGNGLRCIALYLLRLDEASPRNSIHIRMGGRDTALEIEQISPFRAALDLGEVRVGRIDGATIPGSGDLAELSEAVGGLPVGVAWAGNPHAYVFRENLPDGGVEGVARAVRSTGLFRGGVNVTVAVRRSASVIRAVTDERGVGPTQACASGAVALAAGAFRLGFTGASCDIEMPGGVLGVNLNQDPNDESVFSARIRGGAEISFTGTLPLAASENKP